MVFHVLSLSFKDGTEPELAKEICSRIVALEKDCVRPDSQQPYILSFRGGKDNSPEGLQGGYTHAFVAEFQSLEDRDYYLYKDPVHLGLGEKYGPHFGKVQVLDFTHNVHV